MLWRLCLGFDANEILESLQENKRRNDGYIFDLKTTGTQGAWACMNLALQPSMWTRALNHTHHQHSLLSPVFPERAVSPTVASFTSGPQESTGLLPWHFQDTRWPDVLPCPPLLCPKKKNRDTACTLYSGAVAAPHVCLSESQEEMPLPPEENSDKETSSTPQKFGCFKRIRACLSRLLLSEGAKVIKQKVAPLKETGPRTQWKGK